MSLTVKDLFDIEIFKNFTLVAGAGGLDKPVNDTETLDFEFVQGADMKREHVFDGESITLTSFLFAKDNPELITEAVKRLDELNVSCLAYKPVLIKELPQEAIDYADSHNFPILRFGGDEFFEPIIIAVRNEIGAGSDIAEIEMSIESILARDFTTKETVRFAKRLNSSFRRYVRAVAVMDRNLSAEDIIELVKKFSKQDKIGKKAALCKFREGYFIFLTQDTDEISRFDALLSDVLTVLEIDTESANFGFSTISRTEGNFDKVIREAFWSCIVAALEKKSRRYYEDIGIYRFIVSEINSQNMREYMEEYLKPLHEDEGELLKTAKTYILSRGDLEETARQLYCHKNTIRYRLAKMQEMLDPKANEKEFFENLALAIRIYLLMQFKEK